MILQVDTSLLLKIKTLTLNQLVFLSLVLDRNHKTIKDVAAIVSQVSDNEVQDLIDQGYITREIGKNISFKETKLLTDLITDKNNMFETFEKLFPDVVIRPDGSRGFLKSNIKKCRDYYNRLVKNDAMLHLRIIEALKKETDDKVNTGKMGYMKTMWKWLTNSEWEVYDQQISDYQANESSYGTELI